MDLLVLEIVAVAVSADFLVVGSAVVGFVVVAAVVIG